MMSFPPMTPEQFIQTLQALTGGKAPQNLALLASDPTFTNLKRVSAFGTDPTFTNLTAAADLFGALKAQSTTLPISPKTQEGGARPPGAGGFVAGGGGRAPDEGLQVVDVAGGMELKPVAPSLATRAQRLLIDNYGGLDWTGQNANRIAENVRWVEVNRDGLTKLFGLRGMNPDEVNASARYRQKEGDYDAMAQKKPVIEALDAALIKDQVGGVQRLQAVKGLTGFFGATDAAATLKIETVVSDWSDVNIAPKIAAAVADLKLKIAEAATVAAIDAEITSKLGDAGFRQGNFDPFVKPALDKILPTDWDTKLGGAFDFVKGAKPLFNALEGRFGNIYNALSGIRDATNPASMVAIDASIKEMANATLVVIANAATIDTQRKKVLEKVEKADVWGGFNELSILLKTVYETFAPIAKALTGAKNALTGARDTFTKISVQFDNIAGQVGAPGAAPNLRNDLLTLGRL